MGKKLWCGSTTIIIVWHCLNHRLELSVADAISGVHGVNHFRSFMDKVYALNGQSPKNQIYIQQCAAKFDVQEILCFSEPMSH